MVASVVSRAAVVDSRALSVAEELRQRLEGLLVGKTINGCGPRGLSRVTGIRTPCEASEIGKWSQWSCDLLDSQHRSSSASLGWFIALTDLIAMFRAQFAGLHVVLEHASVRGYVIAGMDGAHFIPSGRTVVFDRQKTSVFLRPRGIETHPIWGSAELRVDTGFEERFGVSEPLWACNIDPDGCDQPRGYGAGAYYRLFAPPKDRREMLYVPLTGGGRSIARHLARIADFDRETGVSTFELDSAVEVDVSRN